MHTKSNGFTPVKRPFAAQLHAMHKKSAMKIAVSDYPLDLKNLLASENIHSCSLNLKEPLQPPNLKATVGDEYKHLKYAPPFHPGVGALGSVSMSPLSDHDIALLVLHLVD